MRVIRSLLVALALTVVVVAGVLPSTTAAFTDATAVTGNTVTTGSLAATAVDATTAQSSATSMDVAWSAASATGTSLAPTYTVERSATADGANPTTVYTGGDTRVTDAGSIPAEVADVAFTKIAASGDSTAALAADGALYTWGPNGDGQLGNGSTTISTVPIRLGPENFGGEKVVAIDVGALHAVAATESGAVYTWGNGSAGQIGNGDTTNQLTPTLLPASLFDGQPIVAVTAGGSFTVALAEDGTLYRWGTNATTEGGASVIISKSSRPQRMHRALFGWQRITAVEASSTHTVALAEDGALYTWGTNEWGQLGTGDRQTRVTPYRLELTLFAGLKVTAIAAGTYHTAVLAELGAVYTWGFNAFGQLGVGGVVASSIPLRVSEDRFEGQPVTAIAVGSHHTLAIANGQVFAWGNNNYKQLVDAGPYSSIPVRIAAERFGGQAITAIAAGGNHSVALTSNGGLSTWGSNLWGQLGNGLEDPNSKPPQHVVVAADAACASGATTLADGSCSLTSDTTYYYRVSYALGNWSAPASAWTPLTTELAVLLPAVGAGTTSTAVNVTWPATATPSTYTLERSASADGSNPTTVYSGSQTTATDTGNIPAELATVAFASVAAGELHTLALTTDGEVYTWGNNWRGQLGNRTTTASPTPVRVGSEAFGGHKIVAVAAGEYHSVALADDGGVWTWGYGGQGQLGNGSTNDWSIPAQVGAVRFGGQKIAAIAAGGEHTVALTENGELYTWGGNAWGQLGVGSVSNSSNPAHINAWYFGGRKITSIAAGSWHTVVVAEGGAVFAWGRGGNGQIGDGDTAAIYTTPTSVDMTPFAGQEVVALAAGELHTVALTANGDVYAWGDGGAGQLGNGSFSSVSVPTPVDASPFGGKRITTITAGELHTVAATEDGVVFAWGSNDGLQVGHFALGTWSVPIGLQDTRLGGRKVVGIAAGQVHSVAVTENGGVFTWGMNTYGQLGNGVDNPGTLPRPIAAPTRPTCAEGAVLTGDRCSLTPDTTYYYRVSYTLGDRTGPASAWVPLRTREP